MNIVTLHRDADRHTYFATYPRPIRFEKSIGCWFVADVDDARALLQSRHLRVPDYDEIYRRIEKRSGRSFANLRFAFAHLPPSNNDAHHRTLRRRHAEFLIARRSEITSTVPALVARRLAPLERSGSIDLMAECFVPLVSDFMAAITGSEAPEESLVRRTNAIFDSMIGLRKRVELDSEIGAIRSTIQKGHPGISEEDEGLRLALFILGRDALIGTVGESIYQSVKTNQGRRLSEIDFPVVPNETGVPFVERLVVEAFDHGHVSFSEGQRIRISLQSFAYSKDPADRVRIFGVGSHACLGRQLALDLWQHIAGHLAQIRTRVEVISLAMRTDDFMFTVPEEIIVKVRA